MSNRFRCVLIRMEYVEVEVEAATDKEAANKAFQLATDESEDVKVCPCGDAWFDEDIEVEAYNEDGDLGEPYMFTKEAGK